MSNITLFRRHGRRLVDRAVRAGFHSLADDPHARSVYAQLLVAVRQRSSLLCHERHPTRLRAAVAALRNLARHADAFLRPISGWAGGEGDELHLVHSLASWLLARYPLAPVFGSVWFGDEDDEARLARRWFIAHGCGQRFREVSGLPVSLTRKMERILIASPDHLPLRGAIRRAELLGLGAEDELVDTILATPLGEDLANGPFWRSAMHFFVNHWLELGRKGVERIVEFLYAVRYRSVEVLTLAGSLLLPPELPNFSLAGRTVASLMRCVQSWRARQFGDESGGLKWAPSGVQGFMFQELEAEQPVNWVLVELCSGAQLRREGGTLQHCVASYRWACRRGESSIWSLRRQTGDEPPQPCCTIELDPQSRRIVQIRGRRNRRVHTRLMRMIRAWAAREELAL